MPNKSLPNPPPTSHVPLPGTGQQAWPVAWSASSAARSHGFTLVELMIVLIIIAILGSAVMFAMFSAQDAARSAKTKNMISKLNTHIMLRYETYMNRRVPLMRAQGENVQQFHFRRLQALRELMRMEMPDRWTDVKDPPVTRVSDNPVRLLQRPAVNRTYQRRVLLANNGAGVDDGDAFQGAECLYLIIAHGTEDSDALAHFSQSDIGDTDRDGLPEFLDGWGRPISFIRWPAGFTSPRQSRDEKKEFDQFNVHRVVRSPQGGQAVVLDVPQAAIQSGVPRRFALFPLIYSGGPDRKYDLGVGVAVHYSNTSSNTPYVDPYLALPDKTQVGQPLDQDNDGSLDHGDNIHNHELSIR